MDSLNLGFDQGPEEGVETEDSLLSRLLERRERVGGDDSDEAIDDILNMMVDAQASFGAETEGEPIELDEEIFDEAKNLLYDELEATIGDRGKLDRKIALWRDLYDLKPGPEAYPGAPNFTTPLVRGKVSGFTANIRSTLDKTPFFIAEAATAEGTRSKPAWEATMEREIDLADARRQIFMAVDESGQVGTGPLKLGVADANGAYVIQPKCIRVEDWWISPPSVETVKAASTFERFEEPLHIFMRKVEKGVYEREAAERVLASQSPGQARTQRQEENHGGSIITDQTSDNTPITLYECYYRFGGVMYRVVLARGGNDAILRWRKSPFTEVEAIQHSPPYVAFRPVPRPNYFYGDSYAQVLAGIQGMNDWAMNSLLAYNQMAITPSVFVDEESVVESRKSRTPAPLIYPGSLNKVRGNPNEVMGTYSPPPPVNAERMIQMAQTLGNDATFYDYQLNGQPLGTVRTATEHEILRNASQTKLAEALKNIEYDLSDLGEMMWGLIEYYKVDEQGIYEVYKGQSDQYLLASEEIDADELQMAFIEFGILEGIIAPELGEMALQDPSLLDQIGLPPLEIFIAGAKRGDLMWRPQGGKTVPDRVASQQKHEKLMSFLPIIEAAYQLRPVWHIAKGYLDSLEIQNWRDYLPAEPPDDSSMGLQDRMAIMSMISEQVRGMRMGGG